MENQEIEKPNAETNNLALNKNVSPKVSSYNLKEKENLKSSKANQVSEPIVKLKKQKKFKKVVQEKKNIATTLKFNLIKKDKKTSTSEKVRLLYKAGMKKTADISNALGIHYSFAYGVIVRYKAK